MKKIFRTIQDLWIDLCNKLRLIRNPMAEITEIHWTESGIKVKMLLAPGTDITRTIRGKVSKRTNKFS